MCGIFCSVSRNGYEIPDDRTERLLRNRGPDSTGQIQTTVRRTSQSQLYATFKSTVLSLRGETIVGQPLQDAHAGSVLCWNGEAWRIDQDIVTGNDSEIIFEKMKSISAASESSHAAKVALIGFLASMRGPYAFVFYDAHHNMLYYGRDCLGRRSLLRKLSPDGDLILSSVCDNTSGEAWAEVEADGVYALDFGSTSHNDSTLSPVLIPHQTANQQHPQELYFTLPFPSMNRQILPEVSSAAVDVVPELEHTLQRSLKLRVQHVREAIQKDTLADGNRAANIAILFSGGLDCTILARMCHDLLPLNETIDLLNVAFENPRVHGKLEGTISPYETCPDRITGRSSFAELLEVCPGRRWQFVEIDVPYSETVTYRSDVIALMHPHNTEMDLSISYALYFASRGVGMIVQPDSSSTLPYTTSAHVLLSGLGADELFGGYQRHATAFNRQGYSGLLDELELDFTRLGKRNLGRDDRVISDSGREVRFPYLDEEFIAFALHLPVNLKCDFGAVQDPDSKDTSHRLEPAKRLLRSLAWHLGMTKVATEKKRAIQFGARTAKMETGKTKGTTLLA